MRVIPRRRAHLYAAVLSCLELLQRAQARALILVLNSIICAVRVPSNLLSLCPLLCCLWLPPAACTPPFDGGDPTVAVICEADPATGEPAWSLKGEW